MEAIAAAYPQWEGRFFFDRDYTGRPLVFCGTLGVLPQSLNGSPSAKKNAKPGDRIVMVGGAIGADGIHGATFSSLQLDENAPATVVQIGDPLMQKRLQDFLLQARDKGLYSSLTDNGAGGLSSSVGEMAIATGGADLDLAFCPVKYPGLRPYELMISESQERMTLAVPPAHLSDLFDLAKRRGVPVADLGSFDNSGYLTVRYKKQIVGQLSLSFLHESLPPMRISAFWDGPRAREYWGISHKKKDFAQEKQEKNFYEKALCLLLSSFNIASKEAWTRCYDHQVQAATHAGPYAGCGEGPGDGAVIWAYPHGGEKENALCLGVGLAPELSLYDPYLMAQFSVDEAMRNVVAVGGDPDTCCLLDNFCWPDPLESANNPHGAYRMGQLVRACHGLYDICLTYGTPLVSGKDSMKNNFRGKNKRGDPLSIGILPTLLITALAKTSINITCSSDFKRPGDIIYLLGKSFNGLAASEFSRLYRLKDEGLPSIDISLNKKIYRRYHKAVKKNLFSSGHDLAAGGLLVCLAESMIGGQWGACLELSRESFPRDMLSMSEFFFGESSGRFLVSVSPQDEDALEKLFAGIPFLRLGRVLAEKNLEIKYEKKYLLKTPCRVLEKAWRCA